MGRPDTLRNARLPDNDLSPGERNALAMSAEPYVKGEVGRLTRQFPRHVRWERADELYAECMLAVVRAARFFQPGRGVSFLTYAAHWVRGAATHYRWSCRPKGYRQYHGHAVRERPPATISFLTDGLGGEYDVFDDVAEPGWDEEPAHDGELVARSLAGLPTQWRTALKLRFEDGLLFKEVGRRMGFSKQRAQQVIDKALAHLKAEAGVGKG